MKLYIVTPYSPSDFDQYILLKKYKNQNFINVYKLGLSGFYQYKMNEILFDSVSKSQPWKEIEDSYFYD